MIILAPEIEFDVHAGPQLLEFMGLTIEQFQIKVQAAARQFAKQIPAGEHWGASLEQPGYRIYAVYRQVHALYGTRADYVEFLDGKCTWCDQIDRAEKAGIDPVSLTCDWL